MPRFGGAFFLFTHDMESKRVTRLAAEGPAHHTPEIQLGKRKLSTKNPVYSVYDKLIAI